MADDPVRRPLTLADLQPTESEGPTWEQFERWHAAQRRLEDEHETLRARNATLEATTARLRARLAASEAAIAGLVARLDAAGLGDPTGELATIRAALARVGEE